MSCALFRPVLGLRAPAKRLLPAFLPPLRASAFTTAVQTDSNPSITTTRRPPPSATTAPPRPVQPPDTPTRRTSGPTAEPATQKPQTPVASDPSVARLLPLLRAQPSHYITVHIHARPYLVTPGDRIRLPFRMPGVRPGDLLRLDRASVLGSRDYTLRGAPYLDDRVFECRAVVLGTETEPLRVKVKKKRRNRHARHVKSKHHYTILRLSELKILGPEVLD